MTVQHFVHEPQDLPGTMDGLKAAFHSSLENVVAAAAGVPARPAFLRFASPILMFPTFEMPICIVAFSDGKPDSTFPENA
jgi:hypothetical protein